MFSFPVRNLEADATSSAMDDDTAPFVLVRFGVFDEGEFFSALL